MSFTLPPDPPPVAPPTPSRNDEDSVFDGKANAHAAWLTPFTNALRAFRAWLVIFIAEQTTVQQAITQSEATAAAAALAADQDALATGSDRNAANNSRVQAGLAATTATEKAAEAGGSAKVAAQARTDTVQLKADTAQIKQDTQQLKVDAQAAADKAGAPVVGTRTTSIPVQAGPVVIDVGLGKGFAPGQYVAIARTAAPSTALRGLVTNYTNAGAGPLAVTVDKTDGEGTYAAWTVSLAGRDALAVARERVLVNAAAVTLEHGKDYVLVFAGAVTATMPAAPTWGGAAIGLMVANGRTDNAVAFNGAKHQGIADAQMSIDDPFASFQLVPLNATYGWGIA